MNESRDLMTTYSSNNFRIGMKIIIDGEPCTVESSEFIKPGKGQAFVRVKLRRLLTDTCIKKTFKPSDSAERADIVDMCLTYLYNDSKFWYFMNKKTFEQIAATSRILRDKAKWLSENTECNVTLWNNQPITITPPNFVELKIVNTDPVDLKKISISNNIKSATLSTGAVIKVPLFLQIGEIVKVDTRSGEYVSRIK